MPSKEAGIGVAASEKSGDEMIAFEAGRIHRSKTNAIGVEGSILLFGEVGRILRSKTLEF